MKGGGNYAHYLPPGSRVLAPADGEGRNSVFLAELGHRVVATDIAPEGIAKAQKLAASRGVNVDFRHLDLQGWQWPEAEFDAVVAIFLQFAPPAFRDEIFAGMKRERELDEGAGHKGQSAIIDLVARRPGA